MDTSSTPERPKRAAPKRVRVVEEVHKDEKSCKERQPDSDVDVGVLLASLPAESLLPLLTSLLNAQPSLKPLILQLIPRPSLETALQALLASAKKLNDAYPYSNTSFDTRTSIFNSAIGFAGQNHGGMRDSYILSRLRPHITDFVSACISYLPYFSLIPLTEPSSSAATPLQVLHKDKSHPTETFLFLSALTRHVLTQPPLTQQSLSSLLLPRLSKEWTAWVDRVDVIVNAEGGMFGGETVNGWIQTLDELAEAKVQHWSPMIQVVRDSWLGKVGWLVGRTR